MKHNDDILIDRFLRGELTEEEKKDFQLKLENEEEFSQKVKEMEEVQSGLRESVLEEKRVFLEELEAEVMLEGEKSEKGRESIEGKGKSGGGVKVRRLWWFAAAAVMVVLAMMVWPDSIEEMKGPSAEYAYLFEEEFETLIKHETMRSAEYVDPYSKEQREAYTLFAAQLFKEAIPKLEKLWEMENDSLALEYLGWSWIGIGEDEKGKGGLKFLN